MTDLMRYAAALDGAPAKRLPPIERWNPEHCGEIDLVIRRDGVWVHEGTPIGRARLVRLLSTVLRKEGADHFLVTPVEKMKIRVEDAPFLAVLLRKEEGAAGPRLIFTTNVGDDVAAGRENALEFRINSAGDKAPYVHVRAGLWAMASRAVYHELAALGETREIDGMTMFGVASDDAFFPFEKAAVVYGDV